LTAKDVRNEAVDAESADSGVLLSCRVSCNFTTE
jgi:hypothetical protein